MNPTPPPCVTDIVAAFMAHYEPSVAPDCLLRTTDFIVASMADMYDLETNEVAEALIEMGYSMVFRPDGRHGWGMKPKD